MPTDYDRPQEAAMAYESVLQTHFSEHWPRFDLVLLGVGTDGHTASLFPGSLALGERERRVVATTAPAHPRQRLTLTLPVLNRAARVCFLVAGEEKAEALRCAVERPEDPAEAACPAGSVRPIDGALHWFIDREAASLLEAGKGV